MLRASLIVVGGDAADKEIPLELPAIIGRGRETAITVQHSLVSRQHCELIERSGRLFVRDLNSMNGTFVNNFRIREEELLLPGQLLTLGNITFRASYVLTEALGESPKTPERSRPSRSEKQQLVARSDESPTPGHQTTHPGVPRRSPAIPTPAARSAPLVAMPAATEGVSSETDRPLSRQADPTGNSPGGSARPVHASASLSGDSASVLDSFDFVATPAHSISLSALGGLPGEGAEVSFVGKIQVPQQGPVTDLETSEIDLSDVVASAKPKVEADDSALGSFLRRLPR